MSSSAGDLDGPLSIGIDGGYVHAREGENREAGWFDVIIGKSMPSINETERFASVHVYEQKST